MATTTTPYHFFLANAGYSYDPLTETKLQGRRKCARALAAAERWAQAANLIAVWQFDPDCGPDQFDFEEDKAFVLEHGAVACILYRPCPEHGTECKHAEVLGSLSGITESLNNRERDNYRRVVEAELALEAMPNTVQA